MRIVDRALPPPLFRSLAREVRSLGARGLRDTYRATFWFDLRRPAALPERAILGLAAAVGARRVAGAEWWLSRMRTSDVGVDFHRDRDEALFARTGVERHPAWTSVLFLGRARGGLLAVTAQDPDDANPARAPLPLDADLVRPWPNRLAVLRGDATHGVLDARNRVPAGRLPEATPLRLALVVNWWRRRPERVPRFDEVGRYPSLALAGDPERPGR